MFYNADNFGAVECASHCRDEADILQAPSTCRYIKMSFTTQIYKIMLTYTLHYCKFFTPLIALQPKDVWEFFDAVILQAEDLQVASSTMISTEHGCSQKPPVVTVGVTTLNCILYFCTITKLLCSNSSCPQIVATCPEMLKQTNTTVE